MPTISYDRAIFAFYPVIQGGGVNPEFCGHFSDRKRAIWAWKKSITSEKHLSRSAVVMGIVKDVVR